MKFMSTRGQVEKCSFVDAFLMGLGNDGGLLIPETIPMVGPDTLAAWSELSYEELMLAVFELYVGDEIPRNDLQQLIAESYATFRSPEVAPLKPLSEQLYVLELFHGPTFAFKDVALQFMGNLYAYVARQRGETIHILGATSGDTGAAAISGVRGKEGIRICILHPQGKVSRVQELQMTTVQDENVLNLAVKGNFDDCQHMIKEMFGDLDFKAAYHLRAINSINFVRILAQTVYYFWAYLQLPKAIRLEGVSFSIPTGNFGNIFSGYLAKQMGLPVQKLILATNENNILQRFVHEGIYETGEFYMTYSPSMDIQIASNFERYLYYLCEGNPQEVASRMAEFRQQGKLVFSAEELGRIQKDFAAHSVNGEECLATIAAYKDRTDYLLDPHSACGVAAYEAYVNKAPAASGAVKASASNAAAGLCISLATAHPAKFDEAISRLGIKQQFPQEISGLFDLPQRYELVDNDREAVEQALIAFYQGNQ